MMSNNAENLEMEIKLDLVNERNFARLLEYLPEPRIIKHQTNYFFDTDDWALSRSGWALRLRTTENTATVTVKGRAVKDDDQLTVRPEIEISIPLEQAEEFLKEGLTPGRLPMGIIAPLKSLGPDGRLSMKLQFATDRHVIDFADNDIRFSIDLDRIMYSDGTADYELEAELDNRAFFDSILADIKGIFERLNIPVIFQKRSKFARALKKIGIDNLLDG